MAVRDSLTFRQYLESLPEDLLASVTEDYVWLSSQDFGPEQGEEFQRRRECCREECTRRGMPDLYREAESVVSPWAA